MLVLRSIAGFPENCEVTVAGIAAAVQLSAPTVSRILDRLENAGFIIRSRTSKDRRKVCLLLTESGRRRIENLPTPLHEQFIDRLNELPPEDRVGLLTALERVVDLMGATGIDAAPVLTPEFDVDAE